MRILAIIFAFLCGTSWATNTVYVSSAGSGSATGATCGNSAPASYFNNGANWSATPTSLQFGPDTTVHVTGTFSGGTNAAAALTFQGSGSAGHPIILLADNCSGSYPDFTASYWGISGAINTNGFSFITLDGAGTGDAGAIPTTFVAAGVIENTANGSALANKKSSKGISIPNGSTIVVKDWYIHNIYQRSGTADDNVAFGLDDTSVNCMYFGANGAIDSITVTNNTMTNAGWCLNEVGGTTATISHNDFGGMEHSLIIAPTTVYVFNNHFHDSGIWDSNAVSLPYHHDFWHCFAGSTGHVQTLYYYNNQADGNTGQNFTDSGIGQFNQVLYVEGNGSGTTCMLAGGTEYIFNNVGLIQHTAPGDLGVFGNSTTGDSGDLIVNNTSLGPAATAGGSAIGINPQAQHTTSVENNAIGGYGTFFGGTQNASFTVIDFNAYQNGTGGNLWDTASINCGGSSCDTGSFTTWKTGKCNGSANTCDTNGIANIASSTYFTLSAGCVLGSVGQPCSPQSGSPLRGAGVNLFSVCNGQPIPGLGALCFDKAGNVRPSVAAWDIGAYQFASLTPASSPSCTFATSVIGGLEATCSNPNSAATQPSIMCVAFNATPSTNGLGTGCPTGWELSPVLAGGTQYLGYFSILNSALVKVIAGVSGMADSPLVSYNQTVPRQSILSQNFSWQCGPGVTTNCPISGGILQWPSSIAFPPFLRLHDSGFEWSVVQQVNSVTFNWNIVDPYLDALAGHAPVFAAVQMTSPPCWAVPVGSTCGQIPNYGNGSNAPPTDLGTGPMGSSPTFNNFISTLLTHCTVHGNCVNNLIQGWQMWNEWDLCVHWNGTAQQLYNMIAYPVQLIRAAIPNAIIYEPSTTPAATGASGCQSGTPVTDYVAWFNLENTNGRLSDVADWHLYMTLTSSTTNTPETQWNNFGAAFVTAQAPVAGFGNAPWVDGEANFSAGTGYGCTSAQYTQADCFGQVARWQIIHDSNNSSGVYWYYGNTTIGQSPGTNAQGNYIGFANSYFYSQRLLEGGYFTAPAAQVAGIWTAPFTQASGFKALFVWFPCTSTGVASPAYVTCVAGTNFTVPAGYVAYRDFNGNTFTTSPGTVITVNTQPIMLLQQIPVGPYPPAFLGANIEWVPVGSN